MHKTTFVCIDCEATGLDWEGDQIIEVAVALFTLDKDLERFDTLVDPGMAISPESMKVHHITQEMVSGKPKIQTVLPEILALIGNHIIIGHGVAFDIHLIQRDAKKFRIPCSIKNNLSFDTLRMARLYGESPKNSLEYLREHFNIHEEGAHRALNDVIVNIEVFRRLAGNYKTVDQLRKILEKPIRLKAMPLGKHKGRPMKEIPLQYLHWAANKDFDRDLLYSIRSEIKRRQTSRGFSDSSNPFSSL